MHIAVIKTVPAVAFRVFAVTLAVEPSLVVDDVVLSRHAKKFTGLRFLENLLERIEFAGFCQVREVAGVQN
jgi:hypothetical protein